MNLDTFSATLMSYAIPWSLGLFVLAGFWLYLKSKLISSFIFAIGASLALLNQIMQRFFPTWSASFDEAGNIISMQGPTIETYVFSILGSFGFLLCSVSFALLAFRIARGNNT